MDEDLLVVGDGFVAFLLVTTTSMIKESRSDSLPNPVVTSLIKHGPSPRNREIEPIHNLDELFFGVHRPFQ